MAALGAGEGIPGIATVVDPSKADLIVVNDPRADIDQAAAKTGQPERVIGFHPRMRVIELIRGAATSPETIATCLQLAKRFGKIAVVVGNCPGSAGERMYDRYGPERDLAAMAEEGSRILEAGHALRPVDLDILCVHGYGIPAYLGGPMYQAGRR